MRISDWSSDVCSSDLIRQRSGSFRHWCGDLAPRHHAHIDDGQCRRAQRGCRLHRSPLDGNREFGFADLDRKSHQPERVRSEEHTSELQSLMRISYAVFCLKKKNKKQQKTKQPTNTNTQKRKNIDTRSEASRTQQN